METVRDIVVIVFSGTGTAASVGLLIMGFRLYGPASQALQQFGRVSDDIHEAAEGARTGVRLAKGALEAVGPVLPGPRLFAMTCRVAVTIPRAVRFISRFKGSSESNAK